MKRKYTPQFTQSQLQFDEIQPGYCFCGCGQKTTIKNGKPHKYRQGHNTGKYPFPDDPNPGGMCLCGCGQKAPIATKTTRAQSCIKGKPIRFISGHNGRLPLVVRFWKYVDKRGPDDCWLWTGSVKSARYGKIGVGYEHQSAHRISYELHNGPIPDGLFVCHNCPGGSDNPRYVNPAHLWLGTAKENSVDMAKKKRHSHGEKSPNAKLTESDIVKIRTLYAAGLGCNSIAKQFGVNGKTIHSAVNRVTWKHVV